MQRRSALAAIGSGLVGLPMLSLAQSYPSRLIKVVVPYAAGGGIDGVARTLTQAMADELKQPFVVDNRPGAGGMLGADLVAKAAADGYTLLLAGNPELTITPSLVARTPYSAATDFKPIMLVSQSPNVLVCNAKLGARTLREALEAAKLASSGLSIGTPGNGSPQHIAVELLRAEAGVAAVHVPYKGAAPATVGVLGGEISFALVGAPPVLRHIMSGTLIALAVTQPQRSPLLPNVPTVGEALGVMKNEDLVAWYGLLAPARAPADIVQLLERTAGNALTRPDVRSRLAALGTDLLATPSAGFAERMRVESSHFAEVIRKFQIKAD